jgi:hypothetical protein
MLKLAPNSTKSHTHTHHATQLVSTPFSIRMPPRARRTKPPFRATTRCEALSSHLGSHLLHQRIPSTPPMTPSQRPCHQGSHRIRRAPITFPAEIPSGIPSDQTSPHHFSCGDPIREAIPNLAAAPATSTPLSSEMSDRRSALPCSWLLNQPTRASRGLFVGSTSKQTGIVGVSGEW